MNFFATVMPRCARTAFCLVLTSSLGAAGFVSAQTVTFPDTNLEAAVESALELSSGPVTVEDILMLTNLTASGANIQNATGLQYAANLAYLDISGNEVTNISPVAGLTNLTTLYINGNQITNLSPLDGLVNLTNLKIGENPLSVWPRWPG